MSKYQLMPTQILGMMWTSRVGSCDGTKECAQFQAFHEKPIKTIQDNEAIEKSQDFQNPSNLFVGFSLFFFFQITQPLI